MGDERCVQRAGIGAGCEETRSIGNRVETAALHEVASHAADVGCVEDHAEPEVLLNTQAPVVDCRRIEVVLDGGHSGRADAEWAAQQLRDRVPLAAHAIDRAPLRVLESANMPAVLIEIGFLSNPEQEKQLTVDGFQNTFVQAVYDSVVRFRDALNAGGGR